MHVIRQTGKKIALLVGDFPSNEIYIADADGSNQIKITNEVTKSSQKTLPKLQFKE